MSNGKVRCAVMLLSSKRAELRRALANQQIVSLACSGTVSVAETRQLVMTSGSVRSGEGRG